MSSEKLHKATINIAGKEFPLKLNSAEMQRLHSIEQEINNKLEQYRTQFAHMSDRDSVIMVLISYAFEHKEMQDNGSPELLNQTLSQLEEILSEN